jgi:hypothetical protein
VSTTTNATHNTDPTATTERRVKLEIAVGNAAPSTKFALVDAGSGKTVLTVCFTTQTVVDAPRMNAAAATAVTMDKMVDTMDKADRKMVKTAVTAKVAMRL